MEKSPAKKLEAVSLIHPLRRRLTTLVLGLFMAGGALAQEPSAKPPAALPGLAYTNCRVASVPWSIHLVDLQQPSGLYEIQSVHAQGKAIGLETISEQLTRVNPALGNPVAAINGDFYQRDQTFAGAPRGIQIINGELISAPSGEATFWIDALNLPHAANVVSRLRVIWPNGSTTAFGLNAERPAEGVELYTPAVGASTHTAGGRELILERGANSRWLPLRIGQTYLARVREIRETGNAPLGPDLLVLSVGPKALGKIPTVAVGAVVRLVTESAPQLHGIRMAIGGGPILLREGQRVKINAAPGQAYEFSSMLERHPRTAIGWNAQHVFLVEVDGRQKQLSVGMTLEELSTYLLGLGCTEAMNLDGGGSATLWFNGEVRNSPCDRMEREVANGVVVLKKRAAGTRPDMPR